MSRKITATADALAKSKAALTEATAQHHAAVAAADDATATHDAIRQAIAAGTASHSADELATARNRADYAALSIGAKAAARTEAEAVHRIALTEHLRQGIAGGIDAEGTDVAIAKAERDLAQALASLVKAQQARNAAIQGAILAATEAGVRSSNETREGLTLSGFGKVTKATTGRLGNWTLRLDGKTVPQRDVLDVTASALTEAAKAAGLKINLQSVNYA